MLTIDLTEKKISFSLKTMQLNYVAKDCGLFFQFIRSNTDKLTSNH